MRLSNTKLSDIAKAQNEAVTARSSGKNHVKDVTKAQREAVAITKQEAIGAKAKQDSPITPYYYYFLVDW